jgi:predicted RNA-binding protein with PIN domain
LVFDGYRGDFAYVAAGENFSVIFSEDESADERIEKLIRASANPKTIVVVTDDREVALRAKADGAKVLSVDEFMQPVKTRPTSDNSELAKQELTFTQKSRINQELKNIWLK